MSPPAPHVPERFIPDGEVVLGDPEPDTPDVGRWPRERVSSVPRCDDPSKLSGLFRVEGCPYHDYTAIPPEVRACPRCRGQP